MVDLPYAALQMLTNSAEDRVFYSVQKWPSGEVVTGYRNLPAPGFGEADTILQQIDFRGEPMRMIAIRDEALSYSASQEFVVLIAETLGQRTNVLQLYLRYAILAFVVGVLMISLLTLYAVNFGLRPLAQSCRCRQPAQRTRFARHPPPGPTRRSAAGGRDQRPVWSVGKDAELASALCLQHRPPAAHAPRRAENRVGSCVDGGHPSRTCPGLSKRIDHLAHLVQQMMLLSRVGVQPSNRDDSFGAVNLEELAQQAVEDWSLRAYRAGVDLGLQVEASAVFPGIPRCCSKPLAT